MIPVAVSRLPSSTRTTDGPTRSTTPASSDDRLASMPVAAFCAIVLLLLGKGISNQPSARAAADSSPDMEHTTAGADTHPPKEQICDPVMWVGDRLNARLAP